MEINLDNEKNKKNKQLNIDKNTEEYDNFYRKEQFKVSLINVDSSFRNKSPKNIYTSSVNYLPKDPLTFTADTSLITINYPNHGLSVNDRIIIQNVEGASYILSGNIFMFQNFEYIIIKIKHNITPNYKTLLNKLQVDISIVDETTLDNTKFYFNIPLNSILGIHDIYLASVIDSEKTVPSNVLSYFSVTDASELDADYILIKLPFEYFSLNNDSYEIIDFLRITFNDINGIPVNGINADYPINYQRLQGFHEVSDIIDKNIITINTNYKAISDSSSAGGSKIQIMKIINTEDGYPDANNYTVRLKKNFNNVVRFELISTEFPFIDYLIKSSGKNKNNKIYWKYVDDGNYIYNAEIPEGNYDGTSLIYILTQSMNAVETSASTAETKFNNEFIIDYNSFTQEIKFTAYKTVNVPNALRVDIVSINNVKYFKLTINHPNNLIELKDTIIISKAVAMGIIPATAINITHTVYEVNKSNNSYAVLLGSIAQLSSSSDLGSTLIDNGGGATMVKSVAKLSLLFNYPDTIGNIIGFKHTGQPNAITPYKNIISNFDSYLNDTKLNTVGDLVTTNLLLNLTGVNNYYLLYINDYELVNNNSSLPPAFAKILLSGSPGDILYNTFINYPLEFDFPLSTLNELKIRITYGDGSLPDFRNIEHSFTLKITELVNYPRDTRINSRKVTYLQTMENILH